MTRREEIIQMLCKEFFSIQELANHFRTTVNDILEDFEHIKLSIKPKQLVQKPAFCIKCGFVFKDRNKIKKPSKCPRCKSEWITPQRFKIK